MGNPMRAEATAEDTRPKPDVSSLPPEALAFAARMFDAARNGQMDVFEQALPAGLPPNLTNEKGDSLIMLSSYHGHPALTRLLLRHGADPNILNERRQSPLAGAVFKNEREVVDALIAGGADPRIGEPSAIDACGVFRMEELRGVMDEATRNLERKERGQGG